MLDGTSTIRRRITSTTRPKREERAFDVCPFALSPALALCWLFGCWVVALGSLRQENRATQGFSNRERDGTEDKEGKRIGKDGVVKRRRRRKRIGTAKNTFFLIFFSRHALSTTSTDSPAAAAAAFFRVLYGSKATAW